MIAVICDVLFFRHCPITYCMLYFLWVPKHCHLRQVPERILNNLKLKGRMGAVFRMIKDVK